MEHKLYKYHQKAVNIALDCIEKGKQSMVLQFATGTGKSRVIIQLIVKMAKRYPNDKILVLFTHEAIKQQLKQELLQESQFLLENIINEQHICLATNREFHIMCKNQSWLNYKYVICESVSSMINDNLSHYFVNPILIGFTNESQIKKGAFKNSDYIYRYSLQQAIYDGVIKPADNKQYTFALQGFCERFLRQFSDKLEKQNEVDFCVVIDQKEIYVDCKLYRNRVVSLQLLDRAVEQLYENMKKNSIVSGLLIIFGNVSNEYKYHYYERYAITILDISNILYYVEKPSILFDDLVNLLYFPIADIEPSPAYGLALISKRSEITIDIIQDDYIRRLQECKTGKGYERRYEEICEEVILYLFDEEFALFAPQHETDDNLFRMDILCSLKGNSAFWSWLINHYNSRFVVFEFKNYSDKLKQNLIFVTEKYLFNAALRNVAIIVSRKGFSTNAKRAAEGCLKEAGKLILDITDDDLINMIKKKREGEEPADYLLEKMETMLMSISK